ncbi:hypothetical protein UFOVP239_17 [uncultured Caudovirales phage]|uniref:Uncharacterized protein n=1 Tax=uncultured Caudovirales phage TaxID=2100421 RepID=A0A6J7WPN9_9CAUD|nr:hypothetical protein UFOVP239_17 [uncultured Caudovirales phage]
MFVAQIETQVAGIPALIGVTYFKSVAGDRSCKDSDYDYYGYTESEWIILDRKGYKAAWLERKLNKADRSRIADEVVEYFA